MNQNPTPNYPLIWIYLYLTSGCNLRCSHCWLTPNYIPDVKDAPDGLTGGDVKKIITESKPLGLSNIKLTGGEPFLNKEITEIIEVIHSEDILLNIETNGTLIDQKTSAFLRDKEVEQVSVSIDSPRASFHDTFRGVEGAFNESIRGIENLVREGLNVQVIMSLVRENVSDIEGLIKMAVELNTNSVKINPIMPVGRGNVLTEKGKTLPVEELIELSTWVEKDLSLKYNMTIVFSLPSVFRPITDFINFKNKECHILNILGVVSTGDISICGIGKDEPDLVMGNIRKDELAEIWNNSPILTSLREMLPNRMEGICGRCILKGVCLGACRADAYVLSGSLFAPYWLCQEAYEKGLFPKTRIA